MHACLLAALLVATVCSAASLPARSSLASNKTSSGRKRIINGQHVVAGVDPDITWQCAVGMRGTWYCGCVLVSEDTILTSGHCVRSFEPFEMTDQSNRIEICLGTDLNNCVHRLLGSDQMWIHPSFRRSVYFDDQIDIAVIRLVGKIPLSNRIAPITLATLASCPSCEAPGTQYVVSGFGATIASSESVQQPSDLLLYVRQQAVSDTECERLYRRSLPVADFCAGPIDGESNTDSCFGDSGGGISHRQANGEWLLVGLVTSGTGGRDGMSALCGGGGYGTYVSISQNENFLRRAILHDTLLDGYIGPPAMSTLATESSIETSEPTTTKAMATTSSCSGMADLTGDGAVNLNDCLQLLDTWGLCLDELCPQDLNCDGVVDLNDLLYVINAWTPLP